MANQGLHKENPPIEREVRHKERQMESQVAMGATHDSYSKFFKFQPPTFSKMDIMEDP